MMALNDLTCLLEKLASNADVLEEIYNLTYNKVFLFLLVSSKNYDLAHDLTFETFVRLYLDKKKYRNASLTDIFLIARKLYEEYLNQHEVVNLVNNNYVFSKKKALAKEDEVIVSEVLNLLTPLEALVVYLHLLNLEDKVDITRLVDKPLNQVLVIYSRGMDKLKRYFEVEDDE